MGQYRGPDGTIYEDAPGGGYRVVSPAQGMTVPLGPPDPYKTAAEKRAERAEVRAERTADRADATAQRQAKAAERTADAQTKPTEFQSKSAGFLGRMMQAEKDFAAVPETDRGGRSLPRQALHNIAPGIENTLLNSDDRQKADQAVENFIAASLRQESGAAISSGEFTRQYKIFYPAPGDSPEVIAQKAAARKQAIEGFRIMAGPLADAAAATTTAVDAKPEITRTDADTKIAAMLNSGTPSANIRAFAKQSGQNYPKLESILAWRALHPGTKGFDVYGNKPAEQDYTQSVLGQGLSGANEGLADVAGAPVDLTTAVINAGTGGLNALANSDIPRIEKPFLGSDWLKEKMAGPFIFGPSDDPTKQFARRVGQSVGSAAVPLGGPSTTLARLGGQLLAGAGGGVGAAAAQQLFPGNPLAEMAGEVVGGGGTAAGLLHASKRNAARQIAQAVPTVPQLKEQAGDLYRAAESRGVVASPEMTQRLADDFRGALADEGRISPTGRISEVYPKAREAVQLIDDYAGHTMNPTQIQNVRGVVGDALASPEKAERRLGGILTDVLDQWANPLAPELSEARNVSSRYLTAEQLARARELAGARASQFTGSGFENALRTEYRGLDRAAVKGNSRFNEDVTGAIEKVARGTPASNFFRGLGRLAPTGPVSGLGSIVPGLGVGAMTTPGTGAAVGSALAGTGIFGRAMATRMGIKAADEAELIARNGGRLPTPIASPEWAEILRRYGLAESAKYLPQ